jgi:hypothetical protein
MGVDREVRVMLEGVLHAQKGNGISSVALCGS